MRSRVVVVGLVGLLALTGCQPRGGKHDTESLPAVKLVEQPAASAGGACILWDWSFIRDNLGVTFDVAAAGQVDATSTCVVQTALSDYPNLMLAVVESTTADATAFMANLKPSKATTLKGLGKAGYRVNTGSTGDHGPTVEIAWLSEAKQLQTLKFTFAKNPKAADVTAMNDKLFALAKAMDTTGG